MSNPQYSAQAIGAQFAEMYYTTLHRSPYNVLKFYYDMSKLGRPMEDGSMSITTTMQAIKKKIFAFNYNDFRAEIKSVDAHDSFNGGVLVLVTGSLTGRDNAVRNFTQVFFLVPVQDRGYMVLNDMFRYVDNVTDVVPPAHADDQQKKRRKNKKKKSTSFSPKFVPRNNKRPCAIEVEEEEEEEYRVYGEASQQQQHRDLMKSYLQNNVSGGFMIRRNSVKTYFQKAVSSVFKIRKDSVKTYLKKVVSRVFRIRSKSARDADERASLDIFAEKNKQMQNIIRFDLHGQKVKQAMKLFKIHLLFGAYYRSVQSFEVITGQGKHSVDGIPRLRNSIINFLEKESMTWSYEENLSKKDSSKKVNPGVLCVELKEKNTFGFLHSGSNSNTK